MKSASLFSSLSIRARVMVLAIFPTVLLTTLLSGYTITNRLADERLTLLENSRSIIRYLSVGAEFGLFSNNQNALASLSKAALERSDVDDVIFISRSGNVVYRTSNIDITGVDLTKLSHNIQLEPIYLSPTLWALHSPVFLTEIDIDDFDLNSEDGETEPPLGWVMLLIDEKGLLERQDNIIWQGTLITLIGLLLTIWLALNIGRSITRPLHAITETIEKLRKEELNARVNIDSSGELGTLQSGINNLAKRVQDTRLRLEDQIEDATINLRTALTDLEKKNIDLNAEKRKAEAANEAKDQFLARMSHELRTPMTSVIGFSQLLRKTPLDPQQQEYSAIVQKTSSLLLNLIDDVLDFSKIQSEAITLEHIEFNLTDCLNDVLEMQSSIAAAKAITLYFVPCKELPSKVIGDPTRVRQIFTNLIGNAVKFTERGSVSLTIECQPTDSTVECLIKVTDTGIGIDDSQLSKLFEPFSQADTTITRRFGGSGLGLVISKHFAQLMGGNLSIESTFNEGTEVSVSLPFPVAVPANQRQLQPHCQAIVLDQSEPSRLSVCQWLDFYGAHSQTVDSTKSLLAKIVSSREPNLLVINYNKSLHEPYFLLLLKLIRRHFNGSIMVVSDSKNTASADVESTHQTSIDSLTFIKHPINGKKFLDIIGQPFNRQLYPEIQQNQFNPSDQELEGLNILVAEDNAFNRLLLERVLTFAGAEVTMATNGEHALEMVQQQSFDCILMDVHMPLMDGIEASRQIRNLDATKSDVPIIALTANVIANEAEALKETGVETTLFKPINEAEIIHEIQKSTGTLKRDLEGFVLSNRRRLADYGISEQELMRELDAQITAIVGGYKEKKPSIMRDHSHQLTGLAGLLELVVLEAAATELNQSVKTEDWKEIWDKLWRLQRVINTLSLHED